MNNIVVSVIIPTYNRPGRLKKCINSLTRQTYGRGYEIIIVDDGSKEEDIKECKDLVKKAISQEIRYIRQPHQGPGIARNLGVEHSKGKILVFIDDDCVVPQEWLSNIIQAFQEDCNLSMAGGPVILQVDETSPWQKINEYCTQAVKKYRTHYYSSYKFIPFNALITANMAVKREDFLRLGGFDKKYSYLGDDVSLFYKFLRERKKIRFDKKIQIFHIYTESLLEILIHKCFKYGKIDVIIYNDFFKKSITFDIKLLHLWRNYVFYSSLKNTPLTIYISLDYLKIGFLILFFLIFHRPIIYFLLSSSLILALFIFFTKKYYLFYALLLGFLTSFFLFLGRAWYSLKYKIICI